MSFHPHRACALVVLCIAAAACSTARQNEEIPPVYRGTVENLLRARCARCHADPAPAAGWRATSYVGVIGCTSTGAQAATRDANAPLLTALARPDHAGLVSPDELATLRAWLAGGAPSLRSGVHGAAFVDPRSPESHGQFLRGKRYRPMLDAADADACGRCHEGAPARPTNVAYAAEGATPCTTCHVEPSGPLGCGTCHGGPGRSYPPRDRCFFPGDAPSSAHAAHAETSPSRVDGMACSTCHPTPLFGVPQGTHANGAVEVWFDYEKAGREAKFDPQNKRCTGTCHSRSGRRPTPAWSGVAEAQMGCSDCHASPPASHYEGSCTNCHREANGSGTALTKPTLHVNGKVDLGDGSGKCGACHGRGDDPWPSSGAHAVHAQPKGARAVACQTCHTVPSAGDRHPVGGAPVVALSGLATKGGRRAMWDAATKTCAGTYCHEGAGGTAPAPRWTDGAPASACGACHAVPPPPPHAASKGCSAVGCHVGTTTPNGELTPAGKAVHVDGLLQSNVP